MPLETVNTVVVQDREYGQDGKPLVNQEVTVRLAPAAIYTIAAGAAGNADQVALQPTEIRIKTDPTGFWSVSLVQNSVITPANTFYSVKVGLIKTYDINVPTGAGPFIASNILTGPLPTFPGGSSVAGPITINGNLTVTGTGSFSGALTALAGIAITGGGSVTGGWTIGGLLTMTDAASRLVPGATSFSIRNNANTQDNLIVTNAGNVTIAGTLTTGGNITITAGGLTVTAGDVGITAGRLTFGAAAAKIIPGATSISLRNNADSADNVLVADTGLVTLRNALSIPPAAGGTVAPTSYGSVPIKYDEQSPSSGSSITIPASGSIPGGFRKIRINWQIRSGAAVALDTLNMRFNGDTAANYENEIMQAASGTVSSAQNLTQTSIPLQDVDGNVGAAIPSTGWIEIFNYTSATFRKQYTAMQFVNNSGSMKFWVTAGEWTATPAAITSITLFLGTGPFVSGCLIVTELYP